MPSRFAGKEGGIVRADFSWPDGKPRDSDKNRPCVLIKCGKNQIVVAPITHSAPIEGQDRLEIPTSPA